MATIKRFEDLQVWQRARCLAVKLYRISNEGPFAKDFGLRGQIQRAAVSIVSNIAEGFDRRSNSQFAQFLEIAAGSASEVRAQLYIALDVGYVGRTQFDELFADVSEISGMLTNFMRYLKTTPNKLSHPKTLKPSRSQITKPSNSQTLTLSNP